MTFEFLQRARKVTLERCFEIELELAGRMSRAPEFREGIRAILVDKDRNPKWVPAGIEDVDLGAVRTLLDEAEAPVQAVVAAPPVPAVAAPVRRAYVFGNPLAYALRRGVALALDLLLPSLSLAAILYAQMIAINPLTGLPINSQSAFNLAFGIATGVTLAYVIIAQAIFGTTFGKLLFSLHVYSRRGRMVGLGSAIERTLMLPVDAVLIGFVLALLPGHRRLGDLLGGTVVAQSPLRAFSPLVGALGILVLGAAPFLLTGAPERVFATFAAFAEFGPPLVAGPLDFAFKVTGIGR